MTTQRKSSLNIIKLFNTDHKRVLKQLIELQNAIENAKDGPNIKKATGLLKAIEQEMNEHFRREEESLFPALNHYFEKALKKIGGNIRPESPVKVMLLEHKALRMITQNLETALDRDNMDDASNSVAKFADLIRSHVFREENVLFVVADARLTQKEKAKIAEAVSRIQ